MKRFAGNRPEMSNLRQNTPRQGIQPQAPLILPYNANAQCGPSFPIAHTTQPSSNIRPQNAPTTLWWDKIDASPIPCVSRDGMRYVSSRMAEERFLRMYPRESIAQMSTMSHVAASRMTYDECVALNQICAQCPMFYFNQPPYGKNDLVVNFDVFKVFLEQVKKLTPAHVDLNVGGVSGGWFQVNQTNVPYIRRDNTKLMSLQILRFAAGINLSIPEGLIHPTANECTYLKQLCLTANIMMEFSSDTQLVDEYRVVSEAKVMYFKEYPGINTLPMAQNRPSLPAPKAVFQDPSRKRGGPSFKELAPSQPKKLRPLLPNPATEVGPVQPLVIAPLEDDDIQNTDVITISPCSVDSPNSFSFPQSQSSSQAKRSSAVSDNPFESSAQANTVFPVTETSQEDAGTSSVLFSDDSSNGADKNDDLLERLETLVSGFCSPRANATETEIFKTVRYDGKTFTSIRQDGDWYVLVEALRCVLFQDWDLHCFVNAVETILGCEAKALTPDMEKDFIKFLDLHIEKLRCNKIVSLRKFHKKKIPIVNHLMVTQLSPGAPSPAANSQLSAAEPDLSGPKSPDEITLELSSEESEAEKTVQRENSPAIRRSSHGEDCSDLWRGESSDRDQSSPEPLSPKTGKRRTKTTISMRIKSKNLMTKTKRPVPERRKSVRRKTLPETNSKLISDNEPIILDPSSPENEPSSPEHEPSSQEHEPSLPEHGPSSPEIALCEPSNENEPLLQGNDLTSPEIVSSSSENLEHENSSSEHEPSSKQNEPSSLGHQEHEPSSLEHQELESISTEHQENEPYSPEHEELEQTSPEQQELEPPSTQTVPTSASTEQQELELSLSEDQELEPPSTEHQATETQSTEHQATETQPIEHQAAETQSIEHQATETQPIEHQATETQSIEHQATETQATEHQATEHQATETQPFEHQETETQSTEHQATETQSTEHKATETQSIEHQQPLEVKEQEPASLVHLELESALFESEIEPHSIEHREHEPCSPADKEDKAGSPGSASPVPSSGEHEHEPSSPDHQQLESSSPEHSVSEPLLEDEPSLPDNLSQEQSSPAQSLHEPSSPEPASPYLAPLTLDFPDPEVQMEISPMRDEEPLKSITDLESEIPTVAEVYIDKGPCVTDPDVVEIGTSAAKKDSDVMIVGRNEMRWSWYAKKNAANAQAVPRESENMAAPPGKCSVTAKLPQTRTRARAPKSTGNSMIVIDD